MPQPAHLVPSIGSPPFAGVSHEKKLKKLPETFSLPPNSQRIEPCQVLRRRVVEGSAKHQTWGVL
jgi:hypothetical protein